MPDLVQETKHTLHQLRLSPRKRLGQNFMIDDRDLHFLAESLCLKKGEAVLEIGPGIGFLTRHLLRQGARVTAVEKDAGFATYLRAAFRDEPLRVIEKDVLKIDLGTELGEEEPLKVIGNIPYNITSPILDWLIGGRRSVKLAVLTVQWEVAQRLTARPGTKIWGALSIFTQVYADVTLLRKIGRAHFYPAPNVDSAVVRLALSPEPRAAAANEEVYFSLVGRAFQKRRKTILNALRDDGSRDLGREALEAALRAAAIDARRRPETLTLEEWGRLAALFSQTPGRCSC